MATNKDLKVMDCIKCGREFTATRILDYDEVKGHHPTKEFRDICDFCIHKINPALVNLVNNYHDGLLTGQEFQEQLSKLPHK